MTSQDRETRYDSAAAAIQFALEQWAKGLLTAAPGHIRSYDASTRRATVQPALDILTTDGGQLEAPLIPNVPVVWPSGGGYTFHAPLVDGDPVLLVWSHRGLTGFKRDHGRALPDVDRLLSLPDAMAIPGFGPTTVTPASLTGPVLQSNDGSALVALEPTGVRIETSGTVAVTAAGLTLNGDQVATV